MNNGHPPFFANADVISIDPADIFVPDRIGFLHEDKAIAFGRLMATSGQRDPIKVTAHKGKQPWKLVTGRHRLRGAEIEGMQVFAIEVFGEAEDLAELEASENLHRRPLPPIERAMFVHALCQAAQDRIAREHGDLNAHQLGMKKRWDKVRTRKMRAEQALRDESDDSADKMSALYGWQESAADALNLGKREIRRALTIYRLIVEPFPDLAEPLSKHPVVGENASQLKEIAGVPEETARRAVIELLLADPELSAADAVARAGGVARPEDAPRADIEKYRNQIKGGWGRLSIGEQKRFIPDLAAMLHTTELKKKMRDRLNEELGDA